jgi:WD40 repeat protein
MAHVFKTRLTIRILILICLLVALPGGLALAASGDTTRVSVASNGAQGNDMSRWSKISSDGNYVVFESYASNLVSDDTNGVPDIFVRNRQTGVTERVSIADDESQANNWSESDLAISRDGRYAAFASTASNLVSGDTNGVMDVFVRDRLLGRTIRVSVDSSGAQVNGNQWTDYGGIAISGDGRFVTFTSDIAGLVSNDTNGVADAFVHDLQTGATTRVSVSSSGEQANGSSASSDISDDGHLVVFSSNASNLVSNDTNNVTDIFVRNLSTGETRRVSVNSSGVQADHISRGGAISDNGRYIAFSSEAENLAPNYEIWEHVYVHDLQTGETTRMSVRSDGYIMVGWAEAPTISGDGRYVAFEFDDKGDGMPTRWIYVHDRVTGQTIAVTVGDSDGQRSPYNPSLSADGRFLAFDSGISTLVSGDTNGVRDVFVREDPTYINPAPSVVSITRLDPSPTSAANVRFTVTFSEAVTGVDSGDFVFAIGGSLTGMFITDVSGSGTTYTVTVNTGTGSGGLGLNLVDDNSIVDSALQPLAGNGNFEGEVYMVEKDPPRVTNILRLDLNPAFSSQSVRYTVSFSEAVTGVDASDFVLSKTGTTGAATIIGASGSGSAYTVTVGTGNGQGAIRLDVVDNDSIRNTLNVPLGGTGVGNGNFTDGQIYNIIVINNTTYRSNGVNDGWVLESGEDTNQGGSFNATANTFYLGDNAQDRQFRAFLHFPTYTLPDNAVIVQATLRLKKQSVFGTDPFLTHQNILVDIQYGPFSGSNDLQLVDFQATASRNAVGTFFNAPAGDWYSSTLDAAAFPYISLIGVTQFRLAFQLDDNDDLGADTLQFYSGDGDIAYRPQLQILYYVP